MKGMSLAINTLILLSIAVIVLLVLVGSFIVPARDTGGDVKCQADLQIGCSLFVSRRGCDKDIDLPDQLIRGLECMGATADLTTARDTCCEE